MADRVLYDVVFDSPTVMRAMAVGSLAVVPYSDVPPAFTYSDEWLATDGAFRLGPDLELYRGPQYPASGRTLFGFMADASPDRWGQRLLARREAGLARAMGRHTRVLYGADILLGVEDESRMGALRYRERGSKPYLSKTESPIPPLARLRRLELAARRFEASYRSGAEDEFPDLADLFVPGSSMGGARPKAVIEHQGRLYLAKFPSQDDKRDMGGWEYLVHELASDAGLVVPRATIINGSRGRRVFLSERFDRDTHGRLHYASAMTLLNRRDGDESASYLDLAELVATEGSRTHIAADLEELFARVVFNVAVGNRDDHLRNHGFLREASGWRPSPAFDVNPNPEKREHFLAIDEESHVGRLETVLDTCRHYHITEARAQEIIKKVVAVVGSWRERARGIGLKESDIVLMEGTFMGDNSGVKPKRPRRGEPDWGR